MKTRVHPAVCCANSPRHVLVAPDKFKGTLTSEQAARAIEHGLRRAWPDAKFTRFALTDGGDDFARVLARAAGGRLYRVRTCDTAGRPCRAAWGMLRDGHTAVLDLASASGLVQLPPHLRDPRHTSTFGTGVMIRRAIAAGATTIIIGLGGSATNDGGLALAASLGWKFLDRNGAGVALNGAGLNALHQIVRPLSRLPVQIVAAADVENPLFGAHGAACQFARQKGASPAVVHVLDLGLRRLAKITRRDLGVDLARKLGAGAAGGCGFGLMAFLGANLEPGFDIFCRRSRLEALLKHHDIVVTGEGCFDATSIAGKGPWRLACLAQAHGKKVLGVFGKLATPPPKPFAESVGIVKDVKAALPSASTREHQNLLAAASYSLALKYNGSQPI